MIAALGVILISTAWAHSLEVFPSPSPGQTPSIILISVDTLRADRLSCYSPNVRRTPHIDRLAQEGTLFSQVSSQAPLTLPSHVTMLTSTYPFTNGVRDNGHPLAPGAVTLAGILKSNGYRTAAFVGGYVLDRRFGLDQGFETYDGSFEARRIRTSDPGDVKRPGKEVAKAAADWLKENSGKPFFLFLHIYDLHTPYNLSSAEREKYGEGYGGELAYVDDVIGKFLDFLVAQKLADKSLIVFTSDHGESLGEHGETTHGFFIYQSTLHVPLIIRWPGAKALLHARNDSPAALIDLAPTILRTMGISVPSQMQGRNLIEKVEADVYDVYSESIYPEKHFAASALASVRRGRFKYIEAPKPELFDLAADPRETNNLYSKRPALASAYQYRLNHLVAEHKQISTGHATLSTESIEKLRALGYLAGSTGGSTPVGKLPDPKDKVGDYEEYGRALGLTGVGRLQEAHDLLAKLAVANPNVPDVKLSLGLNLQQLGRDTEAVETFRQVISANPTSAMAHFDLGLSYYKLKQYDQAEGELQAALAIVPDYTKAESLLATILLHEERLDEAEAIFERVARVAPDDFDAQFNLGVLATRKNDWEVATNRLRAAVAVNSSSPEAHNALGGVYLRKHELASAQSEFELAVSLKPDFAWAHFNLGLAHVALKDPESARREFEKALAADPALHAARQALVQLGRP